MKLETDNKKSACKSCGHFHGSKPCYQSFKGCFRCGKLDHRVKDSLENPVFQNAPAMRHAEHKQKGQQANRPVAEGRVYTLTKRDAEASANVITGKILICDVDALVLMDSGSTHSYISEHFLWKLKLKPKFLCYDLRVSVPTGEVLLIDRIIKNCRVQIEETFS